MNTKVIVLLSRLEKQEIPISVSVRQLKNELFDLQWAYLSWLFDMVLKWEEMEYLICQTTLLNVLSLLKKI